MIYWTPTTGSHEVLDLPLMIWALKGYEKSKWGYPTGTPQLARDAPVVVEQQFSGGHMNVFEEFETSGETEIGNKTVANLVIDLLKQHGVEVPGEAQSAASSNDPLRRSASKCPIPDSTQPQYGTITIPPSYDYWACIDGFRDWPHAGYHDYCTKSPDQFPAPGKNAEFSGACARHDQCMEASDTRGQGYGACNNQLFREMDTVCTSVYPKSDARRGGCTKFRNTYWAAVTGRHVRNL
ncbi:LGFP repeat-containing protein [Corynebacterium liangguodongii]|uniref:LGFP repeat-containing protein n=1 Tax=Corynebacterium liangguodongii TaxID=2079535 RepID=UPI001FCB3C82|nr:hypothetical protein [Corynebacterium liangguodongii]